MVLKIIFFSTAFLKVFWKDFGEVFGGFWGVFWSSFSQLVDTFSNSHEHFWIFYCFGMTNCSDLLAVSSRVLKTSAVALCDSKDSSGLLFLTFPPLFLYVAMYLQKLVAAKICFLIGRL